MNTIIILCALFTPWLSSCGGGDGPPGPMETGYEIMSQSPSFLAQLLAHPAAIGWVIMISPIIGPYWLSPYYVVFIVILNISVLICVLLKWDTKYFRRLLNLTHMTGFICFSWQLFWSWRLSYWGFRLAFVILISNILLGGAEWIADNVAQVRRLSKAFFSFLREFLIPNLL